MWKGALRGDQSFCFAMHVRLRVATLSLVSACVEAACYALQHAGSPYVLRLGHGSWNKRFLKIITDSEGCFSRLLGQMEECTPAMTLEVLCGMSLRIFTIDIKIRRCGTEFQTCSALDVQVPATSSASPSTQPGAKVSTEAAFATICK